jgi:hypothetical protein
MWWVNNQMAGSKQEDKGKSISRFKVVVFDGPTRLNKFIEAEP